MTQEKFVAVNMVIESDIPALALDYTRPVLYPTTISEK